MDTFSDRFAVDVLTSHTNIEQLFNSAVKWKAKAAVITGTIPLNDWSERFKREGIALLTGRAGLLEAAARGEEDLVVNSLVGSVGLEATMKALAGGSHIALANKEVLVMAGELVMAEAEKRSLSMLPVDRSSMTVTLWPALSSVSARCDPMNPAPPVIRYFMIPSNLLESVLGVNT